MFASSQPQQSSNLFSSTTTNNQAQKPNLFGSLNTNTGSAFGQPASSSSSSAPATSAPSGGSLFDRITPAPAKPTTGLFAPPTASPQQSTGGIFGSGGIFGPPQQQGQQQQQQPQSGGLFAGLGTNTQQSSGANTFGGSSFGGLGGNNTQQSSGTSLLGGSSFGGLGGNAQQSSGTNTLGALSFGGLGGNAQQSSGTSTLGGSSFGGLGGNAQQSSGTSALGGSTLLGGGSGLFGSNTGQQTQQQSGQQGSNLFGGFGQTTNQQNQAQSGQQQGTSLFGTLGQSTQQQSQTAQQSGLSQSILSPQQTPQPRQKSVMDQMELAFLKWHPQSPNTLFQTYLYNAIAPNLAPFYGPTTRDDEAKWEEALRNKPSPNTIPVAVRGFFELGKRALGQREHLQILGGRLVEIKEGLALLLRRHDLEFSTRAVECRRRHLRLSRRCLSLAAKTQVLRNRGYALDSTEEELRKKLMTLENTVFDPALSGRGEEIWARMVNIRERGRQLERDMQQTGQSIEQGGQGIDEAVMKRCKEILESQSSQIAHLHKEMEQLQKEFAEWEEGKKAGVNGLGR
ncbi:MAG: hypothetical protein Q9191_005592 [Dirinaria sp. TL-2023a]